MGKSEEGEFKGRVLKQWVFTFKDFCLVIDSYMWPSQGRLPKKKSEFSVRRTSLRILYGGRFFFETSFCYSIQIICSLNANGRSWRFCCGLWRAAAPRGLGCVAARGQIPLLLNTSKLPARIFADFSLIFDFRNMTLVQPTPEMQTRIRVELNEDVSTRQKDLEHIKEWLDRQPHLPSSHDYGENFYFFSSFLSFFSTTPSQALSVSKIDVLMN